VSGGFANPIIGGSGALVYPAIFSPGFNVAVPASSPTPSWAILKSGLAYFFGLTLAGGTITGPDYIINTAGVFIYSGAPATGSLIGSWAGASGTDAFGNLFPAGFNITSGQVSGTTFAGSDWIINAAGFFIYSGPPAGGAGGTLAEIPVTPQIVSAVAGVASSTHSFSPPAGSLVVVTVAWLLGSNIGATVTCKDSLGNTFTAGPHAQDPTDAGIAAVFSHAYVSAPGAVTVKATCTTTGFANVVIAPRIITGQAASQAGAGTVATSGSASTAVSKSITTTVKGSLVYLAAVAPLVSTFTAIASTTTMLADADTFVGDTGAAGRLTAPTVTPGAVLVGWTSTGTYPFGFAALEVIPLAGAGNLIGSWAGAAGTDAFGNTYPQGLSVALGAIAGAAITGSSFSGTDFVLNASGLFMYSGTPAAGNLIISAAQAAGSDAFANAYNAGVWTYGASGSAVGLVPAGSNTAVALVPGVTPAAVAGTSLLYGASSGTVQEVDGVDGQTYGTASRRVVTASGQPCTSATFAAFISTIVAAGAAARSYYVRGRCTITPSQAAGGFAVQWTCPGSAAPSSVTLIWNSADNTAPAAAAPVAFINAAAATSYNPGLTMAGAHTYALDFEGTVTIPASTSTVFSVQFATPNAGDNYTIVAGSFLVIEPV
jgi:hypothetical protein